MKSSSIPGLKPSSWLAHPPNKKILIREFLMSGCRESNPALMFPKHVYYRYTTPRYNHFILSYLKINTIVKNYIEKIFKIVYIDLIIAGLVYR